MPKIFMTGQQLFALVADEGTEIDEVYAQMAEIRVIIDLDDQLGLFDEDVPVRGTRTRSSILAGEDSRLPAGAQG